jgi:hypothetical protein
VAGRAATAAPARNIDGSHPLMMATSRGRAVVSARLSLARQRFV